MSSILWDGIPIYRALMQLEQVTTPTDGRIMIVAVSAIQISYWLSLRHAPPFAISQNAFGALVILFLSRLSFVFASSLFALVAYRYSNVLHLRADRLVIFVAVLFSVFCFSRHLEAIGNLMLKGSPKPEN